MAARSKYIMRCNLQADGATASDDWNNPVEPAWATSVADVPCWAYLKTRKVIGDDGKTALIQDLRLMVPLDTAVTEDNRIDNIVDRLGTVLFEGPYSISSVERHVTHLQLILDRVS